MDGILDEYHYVLRILRLSDVCYLPYTVHTFSLPPVRAFRNRGRITRARERIAGSNSFNLQRASGRTVIKESECVKVATSGPERCIRISADITSNNIRRRPRS